MHKFATNVIFSSNYWCNRDSLVYFERLSTGIRKETQNLKVLSITEPDPEFSCADKKYVAN